MSNYRILVVEDDDAIRTGMTDVLKKFFGPEVVAAATGPEGHKAALENEFDLIILDWMLPGMDGIEILKSLQVERPGVPVIMLTAKGAEKDRVAGLNIGADDYVVKPFSVKELLARIEAVLRRSPGRIVLCDNIKIPGGVADMNARHLVFDNEILPVPLTAREFDLLRYFGSHPGRVIGRDEILQRVWGVDPRVVETRTIDMTIARLRAKIKDVDQKVIQTVRSRGYIFAQMPDDGAGDKKPAAPAAKNSHAADNAVKALEVVAGSDKVADISPDAADFAAAGKKNADKKAK